MEKNSDLTRVDTAPDTIYSANSRHGSTAQVAPVAPHKRTSGLKSALLSTTRWGIRRESPEETLRMQRQEMHNMSEFNGSSSSSSLDVEKKQPLTHTDTAMTSFEDQAHTGLLFREDGGIVLQPAPTKDPRDPLNLSTTRKIVALFFLCCFGAMAAAAELILGAMLPVFSFVYAKLDPKLLLPLTSHGGLPAGVNSIDYLQDLGGPPIWHIYLLASLPVLMIGVSNLALIPLAIAVGRRTVILVCGIIAIACACWAGGSSSLESHLAARCFQALGAGTVESLIPFIIQDIAHNHQRNTYISGVFAAQGAIIIALGIASPYLIIYLSWRWVYFITSAAAGFFLCGVFLFLPETRWQRTRAEMNGVPRVETQTHFEPRTWAYDLKFFHGGFHWMKGWNAFLDTLRTFFYPQIFFITILNSAMIGCAFAAGYTIAPALLTKPWSWPFLHLGLCLVPVLIAAVAVGGITGALGDFIANWAAKKRGKRVPENQLLNLILPTICALVGSILFGFSTQNQEQFGWPVALFALGLMAFGFLGANTVGAVYVLECYPHLAGPALVNIASFRCLIAFALSFKVSEWIVDFGYLNSFAIYTGVMGVFGLLIPVVYIYGPAWRRRWPATHLGDRD